MTDVGSIELRFGVHPVNRTYGLYSFDVDEVGCARFLVTSAPGGNNPPQAEFAPVDAEIRQCAK